MAAETQFELRRELRDPVAKEARLARLEELENQVYERASQVVEAVLSFHEVTPGQTEPPPEWVAQYGEAGARQRLEVAKGGWLPKSLAPNAYQYALQACTGIMRGRKYNLRIQQANLNVKLTLPAPTSAAHPGPAVYEVRDLETT